MRFYYSVSHMICQPKMLSLLSKFLDKDYCYKFFLKGIRCHCNNRNICQFTVLQLTDLLRCLISIHKRHHNVHQDKVIITLFLSVPEPKGCIPSPARLLYDHLKISKNVSAPQRYLGPLHGAERHVKKVRKPKYLP